MLDKRYWLASCKHGEVGFSTFATTRQDFEEQCKNHPHVKEGEGCAIEAKEMFRDAFAARVRAMPPWIKQTIKFRREATRRVFRNLHEAKPSNIPSATILGWRLRLSVDCMEGPPRFHLSARPARGGDATVDEMVKLGQVIQVLGQTKMLDLMAKDLAFHFEWEAADVEVETEADAEVEVVN